MDAILEMIKAGATASAKTYALKGRLILSKTGWLMLTVPNALVRGTFAAINESGIEFPVNPTTGLLDAHISVMTPDEITQIGGDDKITERGHEFGYTLGPTKEFNPTGWAEVNKCWAIQVKSPELERFRKSYGLSPIPNDNKHQFHVTVAIRKQGVLGVNATSKVAPPSPPDDWQGSKLFKVGGFAAAVRHPVLDRLDPDGHLNQYDALTAFSKIARTPMGIPNRNDMGDLSKLKPGDLLDFIIQEHDAKRAGRHNDIRIGSPALGLYSWATKKDMPEQSKRIALFRQPKHSYGYGSFQGILKGTGYGAGTVRRKQRGKILVTRVAPDKISFTVADQRFPQRFTLVKPRSFEGEGWLLINTTPKEVIPYKKIHYAKLPASQVEQALQEMQAGTSVQAKIDGAASLTRILENGVEITSYRASRQEGRPIVHTERVFHNRPYHKMPKDLVGTVLKGELYGMGKDKRAIPVQQLGGLLNSTVANSIAKQKKLGTTLKNMIYDVQGSDAPYQARMAKVQEILKQLPPDVFHTPETATTPEEAVALWHRIKAGKHPLTAEGIVIHPVTGKPIKAKLLEEDDVHITGTYPGEGKYKGRGVGGFTYATAAGGPEIGRVGTGLSDELRQELFRDPESFVGRTARVRHQGAFPGSGAFRAPSLLALHEDYPLAKTSADDARPYRDRVEMFGMNPEGHILSGIYDNDQTVGVFGGGVDENEDPAEAAARELLEESGHSAENTEMLDIEPFIHDRSSPYVSDAQKSRAKRFKGSRTRYAAGLLKGEPGEPVEPSGLHDIRFRPISEMLDLLDRDDLDEWTQGRVARRRAAVETIQRQLAQATQNSHMKAAATLKQEIYQEGRKADMTPTEGQIEAGNYRKGHVNMHGLNITIETPKGGTRSGTDSDGKTWSITMEHAYGYIRRTTDKDGDSVDVFLGRHPDTELVFVVDQINPATKIFDEHKVMFGFPTKAEAKAGYLANYEEGWKGLGKITPLTMKQFKTWLTDGCQTKPVAVQTFKMAKKASNGDTTYDLSLSQSGIVSDTSSIVPILIVANGADIRLVIPQELI